MSIRGYPCYIKIIAKGSPSVHISFMPLILAGRMSERLENLNRYGYHSFNMNHAESHSRGLLGHWTGERSPGGIVWDHSPEGNHGNYGFDARWIWFTNPRAYRHVGNRDRTYVSYLGGPTGTDIVAAAYDHDSGSFTSTVVEGSFSKDDHTNPAIHVRDDGHVLLFWAGHNGNEMFYEISDDPESVTTFGSRGSFAGESVTYPNPVQSPDGRDDLYLFYRDRVYTKDTTNNRWGYIGDGNVYYRVSEDGGKTWGDRTEIAAPPDGHYSLYFIPSKGLDAVHLFFTDAERGGDAPKWNVMYAKFRDGSFYAADGRLLAGPSDLPMTVDDLDMVYNSRAQGNADAWIWDAAVDDDGNPVVAYATFPSTFNHEYRYARWDGERWLDYHLVDAGQYIAQRPIELHYSGGLAIDPEDPSVVYGCVTEDGKSTLRRFETQTGGKTWAVRDVTRRSVGFDIRPVVPRNAHKDIPVLWLTGSYKHMDASQTTLSGLPSDQRVDLTLEADGRQGVDLGLDLYDAETFIDGVTLAAKIEPMSVFNPGIVGNIGGSLKLGTALDGHPGVGLKAYGENESVSVSWPDAKDGEEYHVTGRWDGTERLSLAIDGQVVEESKFYGPLSFADEWASWTLLKDEFLFDHGYEGKAADIRIYGRRLTDEEVGELASR